MKGFVLVVDDDPLVLDLIKGMLDEMGWSVLTTSSAEEGLRLLSKEPRITVLVTDVEMPGMDGVKFGSEARRLRGDLRVGYVSGGSRLDCAPFLAKPFSRDDLLRTLVGR